jgi:hypothetical protein
VNTCLSDADPPDSSSLALDAFPAPPRSMAHSPPHNPDSACLKPTLAAVSLGSALQLQLHLDDDDDDNVHHGDDEQDYDRDDDAPERSYSYSHSRSSSHSPAPPTPPQPQPQPTSTPTPSPNPFSAHVHFHSRVRITSGLRRSPGNRTLNDSSDSDSPSSSISAPLRYRSQDSVPRLPLGERVSRLAAQALQKRRLAAAAAAAVASPAASRRLRATSDDREYAPFLRAGVPVTYGAVQHGDLGAEDADTDDDNRSQIDELHGEDAVTFGRWPWRAPNRHVSSGSFLLRDAQFVHGSFLPLSGGGGRSNQLCVVVVLMSRTTTNDRNIYRMLDSWRQKLRFCISHTSCYVILY